VIFHLHTLFIRLGARFCAKEMYISAGKSYLYNFIFFFPSSRELETEKQKTDNLLYSVLPPSVANELRHRRPVEAKRYDSVTVLFSGVVGFTEYCARHSHSPMKIVGLLNAIYTTFDVLTDPKRNPNVYKVSEYMRKQINLSAIRF